jgi:Glycosyltransferase family 87
VALPLAVGGTDLPVLGLLCLGLAFLWEHPRPVAAGIALGVAASMKATAWPALVVAVALIATRRRWRPVGTFLLTAAGVVAVLVGPVAVLWPRALVENTISFPLGLTRDQSRAASPLPGHLIAGTGSAGHLVAVALLVAAGVGIAAWLVVSPPRTVRSAAWRLVVGLTLMFALAPATRFGYFIYPAGLCAWLWLSAPEPSAQPADGAPGGGQLEATAGVPGR